MKVAAHLAARSSTEAERGRARPFFSGGATVQAKLRVCRPGDPFEREADHAADAVVHHRGPLVQGAGGIAPRLTPTTRRQTDEEAQTTPMAVEARSAEEELQCAPLKEEEKVQRKADTDQELQTKRQEDVQAKKDEELQARKEDELQRKKDEDLQPKREDELQRRREEEIQARSGGRPPEPAGVIDVEQKLRAAKGLGNPLPTVIRQRMEGQFGAELSVIRIHTDSLAIQLTKALRAQAFTHGRDIYFNTNRFSPGTTTGDHLLAHEIAHTIQQGAVKEQVIHLKQETGLDLMQVRPEALEAIRLARAEIGQVNAKITDAEGNRVGWEHLLKFFRTAFGGDTVYPGMIQKITMVEKNGVKHDALPSWCGIFVWYALKTAGVPLPNWKAGMSVLGVVEPRPPGTLPKKGDIAYRDEHQHFAIVSGLESSAEAAGKAFKDVRVATINGNTSGADNLGGQILEIWGPISSWRAFFDPMAKLKMPDVPLVTTTRAPDDVGKGPKPAPTDAEKAAQKDKGPTDISKIKKAATPELAVGGGPGAGGGVNLELPLPAPAPPPEPIAKVEKVALTGSSDAAMQAFTSASASAIAATAGDLGPALGKKVASEQVEAAKAAPALKAQTGGDIHPVVTPPAAIPTVGKDEVGDGVEGPTPAPLEVQPHTDKAPPPSNTDTERLMDKQPEGGFFAWLRSSIGNLMANIRTTDPGVSTSAGPRQHVALQGDSDPTRMNRQQQEGTGQLSKQRDAQVTAFRNHPGQSNIKPRKVDETRKPVLSTDPAATPDSIPPSQGAQDYLDARLPKAVRDKADAALAPTLQPGLKDAGARTGQAAKARDTDSTKEKDAAAQKARKINEQADAHQKTVVVEKRQDVARQQGEGIKGAYEKVQQFADDATKKQADQKKGIADHVEAEEGKARKALDDGEKEAEKKKAEKEKEAAEKKKELEKEQKKQSWWDRAVNLVKKAVKAVTEAIDSIFNALRKAVATIIQKAKEAAVGLINRARDWVVSKLNDFRDWAKSQIDKYLKDTFPNLARAIDAGIDATVNAAVTTVNAVADAAIKGVEALANGLAKVLDKILSVYQTALKAAVQIAGAVVTGDFAEALKVAIQAACDIAGIDSKPIFDFFDRAGKLITTILKDVPGFIGNLMRAVGQGIRNFGKNILIHLQKGLIEWLTGTLTEAGIQLPEKFDLMGIFSLVAQILGLTYANIKARIIKKFPQAEKVFDLIEKGFALVMKLKDLDFSGLWEAVKAQLANLKDMVIGGIRDWVVTNVIKEGIIWLLSLLNPASAIVKALKAIFDLVMWLVERFNQIKDFVLAVYDSVAKIAAGITAPAAKAVENALARILPVIISLLASLIGLGGVSKAIKNLLEKITAPINKVIDAVVDKVVAFAKKLFGAAKSGVAKAKEKIKAFLWPKKSFSAGGESHTLFFDKSGRPMIRSTPQALESFIAAWENRAGTNIPANKQEHLKAVKAALAALKPVSEEADKLENAGKEIPKDKLQKMLDLQTRIADALRLLLDSKDGIAKAKERYKLEGLAGTYKTVPKPTGDNLTGDHQPQAALFKYLAGRHYFQLPEGAKLQHRAAGSHADNAYVINLEKTRHAAGRTYGSKGSATKQAFIDSMDKKEAAQTDHARLRKEAVVLLRDDLAADVSTMLGVYARGETDNVWKDLDPFTPGDKDAKKTLVDQIRSQVKRGEAIMAGQPMAELEG